MEVFKPLILNSIVFIFFPILILIWEQIILFAPFFAVILINKNRYFLFFDVFVKILMIFFHRFCYNFIFLFPLSNEGHNEMCKFLVINFDERCYMSADLLN